MRALLIAIDRAIGAAARVGVAISAVALLTSLVSIGYGVFMRYVVNRPVPWADELTGYLLVAIVMLAAADALRRGEHIAVDLVTERLGPTGRRITTAAGMLAVAVCGLVLVTQGWATAAFSRMIGIVSTGSLSVPMWLPQILVPIGAVLLVAAAAAGLMRALLGLPPAAEPHPHGDEAGVDAGR